MLPYYEFLLADPAIAKRVPKKQALIDALKKKNEAELARLQETEKKAEEGEGEVELHTVLRQRAMYLAKIGDKEKALTAVETALDKAIGLGAKIDLTLLQIRLGLFFGDTDLTQDSITRATGLIEEGGDWDRRNRLTAYRAVYHASVRSFAEASKLCLEALSTFTATELMEYEQFVELTILMGMITLSRRELKKMTESPEVMQTIDQLPHLASFTSSLYNSEYAAFFRALAEVEQTYLLPSRVLSAHTQYYVREMRVIAFAQLLESYQSVALDNMAAAFGVSTDYIDQYVFQLTPGNSRALSPQAAWLPSSIRWTARSRTAARISKTPSTARSSKRATSS